NADVLKSKVSVFVDLFLKNKMIQEQEILLKNKELAEQKEKFTQDKYEDLLRYQSLANSVPHLIWRTDINGKPDYSNQKWYQYTGLDVEQRHKLFSTGVHAQDLKRVQKKWAEALANSQIASFNFECRIRNC